MNNYRVLVFAAATLLVTFCLAPSINAQTTNSSMMHDSEMMTHDKSMGHNETTTMSSPTDGGHMSNTDSGATEHMKSGHMTDSHMMDSHMTETEHGKMSDGGSTGPMNH